jgi:hypothetical protein
MRVCHAPANVGEAGGFRGRGIALVGAGGRDHQRGQGQLQLLRHQEEGRARAHRQGQPVERAGRRWAGMAAVLLRAGDDSARAGPVARLGCVASQKAVLLRTGPLYER